MCLLHACGDDEMPSTTDIVPVCDHPISCHDEDRRIYAHDTHVLWNVDIYRA